MRQKKFNPYRHLAAKKPILQRLLLPIAIILISTIAYLIFSSALQLNTVEVKGTFAVSPEEIGLLTQNQLMEGRPWFGAERNILLFDSKRFAAKLQRKYAIERVEIKKRFPKKLEVFITEEPRKAVWISRGISFALDAQGKILGASRKDDAAKLRIYDLRNLLPSIGEQALSSTELALISRLSNHPKMETLGVRYIARGKDQKNALSVMTRKNFEILIDPSHDLDEQLNNLQRILTSVIPSDKLDKLEYIDLRFDNRIFYKVR